MAVKRRIRTIASRPIRFFKFRVLHHNDSSHRLAMGVAVGFFIAWTPALGLHIFMALGLAILLRANKFTALTCVWVNNPFTLFFIYYPNFLVGRALLGPFRSEQALAAEETFEIFN